MSLFALCDSFEYLCYGSMPIKNTYFFSAGTIQNLLTYKDGPRAERVKPLRVSTVIFKLLYSLIRSLSLEMCVLKYQYLTMFLYKLNTYNFISDFHPLELQAGENLNY